MVDAGADAEAAAKAKARQKMYNKYTKNRPKYIPGCLLILPEDTEIYRKNPFQYGSKSIQNHSNMVPKQARKFRNYGGRINRQPGVPKYTTYLQNTMFLLSYIYKYTKYLPKMHQNNCISIDF